MYLFVAILDAIAAIFYGLNIKIKVTEKKFNKNKGAIIYYGIMCVLSSLAAVLFFDIHINK